MELIISISFSGFELNSKSFEIFAVATALLEVLSFKELIRRSMQGSRIFDAHTFQGCCSVTSLRLRESLVPHSIAICVEQSFILVMAAILSRSKLWMRVFILLRPSIWFSPYACRLLTKHGQSAKLNNSFLGSTLFQLKYTLFPSISGSSCIHLITGISQSRKIIQGFI